MKRMIACILIMMGIFQTLSAQTGASVKGRVIDDSTGAPLAGVSVVVRNSTLGTTSGADGNFSFTPPGTGSVELVFSYTGFVSQTMRVNRGSEISVTLRRNISALDDVVVVGYSTVRRRDLTGSVSSVNSRQLRDIPLSSAAEALTGKLAGVQITTTEGAPGADVIIRVRGGSSITQDNTPIYIVDGIQVENALNVISPQDIASVDVLKDASTTAIYGARGANGVVIITTKAGRPGKTQVSYNGSYGFREISKKMDVMSPYDYVLWQYERTRGSSADSSSFANTYGTTWDTLKNYRNITPIDWQEEVFGRRAGYQNHNVAVSGGNQNTTFNLSLTANKEDGVLIASGFDRKLANFKLDHRSSEKFRLGFTVRYLDQTVSGAGTTASGTRTTNRLRHSIIYRPLDLPTTTDPDQFDESYYLNSNQIQNPVILTEAEYRRLYTTGTNISGYVSYKLLKNLTFKTTAGVDNTTIRQNLFFSKLTPTARNNASLPVASIRNQRNTTLNVSNTLDFTKNGIAGKHDVTVLLGQEIYETKSQNTFMETRFFPADISPEKALSNMSLGSPPSGSAQPRSTSEETPPSRIASWFGRINYAFDKKLLASFSLRADRSSKFKYEKGLLVFPSGSVAYRFSQENFMKGISWINDAKIRAGFGTAGNNRIGDLLYLQLYGVTGEYALNHTVLPGFAPSALANEDLQWEKTVSQNIGLDLSFLKSRLSLTVDYYQNRGKDLLLSVAIPPVSGYTSQIRNLGETSNKGWEFQLNGTPIEKKNFSWNSNFNISFNKNRVENLGTITQQTRSAGWQGSDGADDYLVKVGEPVGLMYGFVTDGWYTANDFSGYDATNKVFTLKAGTVTNASIFGAPQPGSIKLKDLNGDGVITTDGDRTVIGNANPDFTGGWNNQFTYKNFDASIFMNFVVGNDIYNANRIEWTDGSFLNLNMLNIMKDRWKTVDDNGQVITDLTTLAKYNENAQIWAPVRNQRYYLHSWAIEDGSFLRVNNVTLGYTLPKNITQKLKISSFRVYATVNNLATFTNYSGFDPEISTRRSDPLTQGVDFAGYPRAKTYVLGINVNF